MGSLVRATSVVEKGPDQQATLEAQEEKDDDDEERQERQLRLAQRTVAVKDEESEETPFNSWCQLRIRG